MTQQVGARRSNVPGVYDSAISEHVSSYDIEAKVTELLGGWRMAPGASRRRWADGHATGHGVGVETAAASPDDEEDDEDEQSAGDHQFRSQ